MEIKVLQQVEQTAKLPSGSKLLTNERKWVTWYRIVGTKVIVSTCRIENFECQNDTSSIELWKSEIRELAKLLK